MLTPTAESDNTPMADTVIHNGEATVRGNETDTAPGETAAATAAERNESRPTAGEAAAGPILARSRGATLGGQDIRDLIDDGRR